MDVMERVLWQEEATLANDPKAAYKWWQCLPSGLDRDAVMFELHLVAVDAIREVRWKQEETNAGSHNPGLQCPEMCR